MIFKKISKFLIILGVISIIYWPKVFQGEFFIPLRFELIFFLGVLAGLIYLVGIIIFKNKLAVTKKETELFLILLVFFTSIVLATAISLARYNLWFDYKGLAILLKLIIGILLLIVSLKFIKEDQRFYKKLSLAFFVPSLIFIPFLMLPDLASRIGLLSGGERFQGLTANPGQWAHIAIISFSYLLVLSLYSAYRKETISMLYFALTIGMGALIFWSQSRGYLVAMILITILSIATLQIYFKKSWKKSLSYLTLGTILIFFAFLFMPSSIKPRLEIRIQQMLNLENEPRIMAWQYYSRLIPSNLLGLGVNFEQKFLVDLTNPNGERQKAGPHSMIDLWIYGGFVALFCMFYLLKQSFLNLKRKIKEKNNPLIAYIIGTQMALTAIWIAALFSGAPINYLHCWILFAMALV